MKLVKEHTEPKPGLSPITMETAFMGQELLNPPSVEGWHTGREWIDSGTLVERINFVADQVGNPDRPGVRLIIDRMSAGTSTMSPEEFTDGCLDLMGPLEVSEKTRHSLIEHARSDGPLQRGNEEERNRLAKTVVEMLQTDSGYCGVPVRLIKDWETPISREVFEWPVCSFGIATRSFHYYRTIGRQEGVGSGFLCATDLALSPEGGVYVF